MIEQDIEKIIKTLQDNGDDFWSGKDENSSWIIPEIIDILNKSNYDLKLVTLNGN